MPEVRSTADLIPTPEFVGRFLENWAGPRRTARSTVVSMLSLLGRICLHAVERGFTEASHHDARPIPLPAGWDKATADHVPGPSGRIPTRAEVTRLLDHLRAEARNWEKSRLHALVAAVAGTGLLLVEAVALTVEDIDLRGRTIRVVRRERLRTSRFPTPVPIPDALAEVLNDWLSRIPPGCEYVFPNLSQTGPWYLGQKLGPDHLLRNASRSLEIGPITFAGLRRYAEADRSARALEWPAARPHCPPPGRRPSPDPPVTIARLRTEVLALYEPPRRSEGALWRMRRVFDLLAKLPGVQRTTDLGPAMVAPMLAAWGGTNPNVAEDLRKWLRTVARHAVHMGYLEFDPFINRATPMRHRGPRPKSPGPVWTPTFEEDTTRGCPVALRGRDLPILIMGRPTLLATWAEYDLVEALVREWPRRLSKTALESIRTGARKTLRKLRDRLATAFPDCAGVIEFASTPYGKGYGLVWPGPSRSTCPTPQDVNQRPAASRLIRASPAGVAGEA